MKTTTKEPKYLPLLVTPLEFSRMLEDLMGETDEESVEALKEMLRRANDRAMVLEHHQGTVLTDAAVSFELEDKLASELLGD